ncbi:MAG: hypothetical protein HY905_16125 [Deltaproteobacteria bacterium]|nr:hypothetical protein [Deltaproteobacteria bacterium]
MKTRLALAPLPGVLHLAVVRERAFLVLAFEGPCPPADAAAAGYARIARELRRRRLAVVHERVFGSLSCENDVRAARADALATADVEAAGPVTYVEGRPPWGEGLAGAIVAAVDPARLDAAPRMIVDRGAPRGRVWRADGALFVTLQSLPGPDGDDAATPPLQARRAIAEADRLLRTEGTDFRAVVRTWFYLRGILEWYPEFNRERTAAYRRLGVPGARDAAGRPPASTGIGAATRGAACAMDLLAVAPDPGGPVHVEPLVSPVQPDAVRYGSLFSRGAVVRAGATTLVELSGTAAVGSTGATVHAGDVRGQTSHALAAFAGLLAASGGRPTDLCAATAFVRRAEDAGTFRELAARRGLDGLPALCVVGDICREDLLFEIDGEALLGE